ncbi:MAG: methyltransferase [Pseudomonadota bacterium]|nr:methyltransferase [Pseudomonadota bacterium]
MRYPFTHTALAIALFSGALVAGCATVAPDYAAFLASPARPAADTVRDADRKPGELMAFGGIKPGTIVAELVPGGGYYTRLLSLAVGPTGHVYTYGLRANPAVAGWAQGHPNVTEGIAGPGVGLAPVPVDVVWTTLNYHDLKNSKTGDRDNAAVLNEAAFKALKPGGYYLINDHQTAKGVGITQTATLHRIEDVAVIREVEAAGFKLDARSAILAHPGDDHTLKVVETGIRGKTDQFVLRFRKPR